MTYKSNDNIALTFVVIAFAIFTVAGLAVVPALPEMNAESETELLKNNKEKNPNHKGVHKQNHDYIIDKPVVQIVSLDSDPRNFILKISIKKTKPLNSIL